MEAGWAAHTTHHRSRIRGRSRNERRGGAFTRMTRRHRRITTGRNKEHDEPTTAAATTTTKATTPTCLAWEQWHAGRSSDRQSLPVSRRLAALPVSHHRQTAGPHGAHWVDDGNTPGEVAAGCCELLLRCGRRASAPGTRQGQGEDARDPGMPSDFYFGQGIGRRRGRRG